MFCRCKTAFDTVNRECLWYKLLKLGIKGKMYHAVESLYNNVRCAVNVNDVITPFLNVNLGVKQGCPLSPTLFALYVNDLAEEIKALNCGIEMGDDQLALLLFAEDVVLIGPTEESLQRMLDKLYEWCSKLQLTINKDKTKIIHFRPVSMQCSQFDFKNGYLVLELTDTYKYLGLWFN